MPLTSRATVVLPVPGLPVKTRWRGHGRGLQSGIGPQLLDAEHGDLPMDLRFTRCRPIRASTPATARRRRLRWGRARRG